MKIGDLIKVDVPNWWNTIGIITKMEEGSEWIEVTFVNGEVKHVHNAYMEILS